MNIFKCKMCGGEIELINDKTIGVCDSCGSRITLPQSNDEQRLAMFNRGNAFRIAGEFDKALSVYENIIFEDDTDAEAHWCCALCRFGIEYVEDPELLEYIPTCHRASYDNILNDIDYLAALKNADEITQKQYQREAKKISEVQKGILSTSQNEDPFDVFICYKETDDSTGERTKDSIDAQDIYYQLTDHGIRTFFSRITLENISGSEYEPYIFSALNSAKVMIVVGSKPEYFNAVWVKNEWSRFLSVVKKDRSKSILPCYKNMNPYDLPDQLSVLQSYDMTKIGFIQDLLRGINKILGINTTQYESRNDINESSQTIDFSRYEALLKRANIFLEDGRWEDADEYFEKVLDIDPECSEAYLGKFFTQTRVRNFDELNNSTQPFLTNYYIQKACKYDSALENKLKKVNNRIFENKLNAISLNIEKCTSSKSCKSLLQELNSLSVDINSNEIIKKCNEKIIILEQQEAIIAKDNLYRSAIQKMSSKDKNDLDEAINIFNSLTDWKDSKQKLAECQSIIALIIQRNLLDFRETAMKYVDLRDKMNSHGPISRRYYQTQLDSLRIKFGKTSSYNTNVKAAINWKILSIEKGKALIVADSPIRFNYSSEENASNGWADSYLRTWLNKEFYTESFCLLEREKIAKVESDKIFILDKEKINSNYELKIIERNGIYPALWVILN